MLWLGLSEVCVWMESEGGCRMPLPTHPAQYCNPELLVGLNLHQKYHWRRRRRESSIRGCIVHQLLQRHRGPQKNPILAQNCKIGPKLALNCPKDWPKIGPKLAQNFKDNSFFAISKDKEKKLCYLNID